MLAVHACVAREIVRRRQRPDRPILVVKVREVLRMIVPVSRQHVEAHEPVQTHDFLEAVRQLEAHESLVVQVGDSMRRLQKRAGGNHVHLARNTRCIGDPIEAAYAEITRAALRGKQANFGHIDSARFGRESISVFAFADVAIILGRGELHDPILAIDADQHLRTRAARRSAHREQCVKILGAVSSEHVRAFLSQLIEVRRSRRTR